MGEEITFQTWKTSPVGPMQAHVVMVVLTLFTSFPTISTVCPNDYPYQYQCSCYKVVQFPQKSRWNAKSQCENEFAHLVFINSEEEKEALAVWYPKGETFFWIGLNGIEVEDKTWDDGSSATYTNFGDHPLTFNDEVDCYRIVPYGWIDVHPDSWLDDACSNHNSYICEYEDAGCSTQLSEAEQSGCPRGFTALFECSCYYIRPAAWKTITEARAICESLSSHLVFIESQEETDFLIESYNANFHYWIGLNGMQNETKTWDDGTEANYTYFGTEELGAFNDHSGCYRIVSQSDAFEKWYDWDCEGTFGFICEYDFCQTTTAATTTPETTIKPITTFATTTLQTTRSTTPDESTTTYTTRKTSEPPDFQGTSRPTTEEFTAPATTVHPSTEESRSDVGIFFGFYTLGSSIRSGFYFVQNVPEQSSIVSCASKCSEVGCGAFSFQYQTSSCKIAASIDTLPEREPMLVHRTFSCLHGDDFEVCL